MTALLLPSSPHINPKYAGRGLSGIVNRGNTCYMNACLSVLSHTYELNDLLDNAQLSARRKTLPNRKANAILMDEWDDLRKILWKQNCTVSPGRFISAIQHVARETSTVEFQGRYCPAVLRYAERTLHARLFGMPGLAVRRTNVGNYRPPRNGRNRRNPGIH